MTVITPDSRIRSTSPKVASIYSEISKRIKAEGLLERTPGFYIRKFVFWMVVLAGAITGSVFIGESWWQVLMAVVFGIVVTQIAFMAHEASHRQVFKTNRANDRAGIVLATLFAGLSYDWWMSKHTRHHANPNLVGKDPDIAINGLAFTPEQVAERRGLWGFIARHQGVFFFPLLMFTAFDLLSSSLKILLFTKDVKHRWVELTLFVVHYGVLFALPFVFFSPLVAGVFVLTQLMVFGLYMGLSFAPNHKGMPVLPHDAKVDFFSRQVLTSRNIRGGWFMDNFMGGLNYQIEHHLFPSMSRPHLRRTQALVREYCEERAVMYTETSLFRSYWIVMRYLSDVGIRGRDPFDCPMVNQYRRRD